MGGQIVMPAPDPRMEKTIRTFLMNPVGEPEIFEARIFHRCAIYTYHSADVSKFYKIFTKLDKDKIGLISINNFFKFCEMERNIYTDGLCDVIGIDLQEGLNNIFCGYSDKFCWRRWGNQFFRFFHSRGQLLFLWNARDFKM